MSHSQLDLNQSVQSELEVTVETAKEVGLTADEFSLICQKLGRTPSYTELGDVERALFL